MVVCLRWCGVLVLFCVVVVCIIGLVGCGFALMMWLFVLGSGDCACCCWCDWCGWCCCVFVVVVLLLQLSRLLRWLVFSQHNTICVVLWVAPSLFLLWFGRQTAALCMVVWEPNHN